VKITNGFSEKVHHVINVKNMKNNATLTSENHN